jgi:hypothetical protein
LGGYNTGTVATLETRRFYEPVITTFAAPPGCDLDDEDAWHPALGDFLHIGALRSNRRTMCESSFRADRLGQWLQVDDEAWLPPGARDVCTAPGGELGDGAEVEGQRPRNALNLRHGLSCAALLLPGPPADVAAPPPAARTAGLGVYASTSLPASSRSIQPCPCRWPQSSGHSTLHEHGPSGSTTIEQIQKQSWPSPLSGCHGRRS